MGIKKPLIVVDMQNDFIDGSLGTKEAVEIVDNVVSEIKSGKYDSLIVTYDTHEETYLEETLEGKNLPVKHCIIGTEGWKLNSKVAGAITEYSSNLMENVKFINKETFGTFEFNKYLNNKELEEITICGLCTDVCVLSNAIILRAQYPNTPIYIVENATAGITPEKKKAALEVLASCQVYVKENN